MCKFQINDKQNNIWLNPYHMLYQPETPIGDFSHIFFLYVYLHALYKNTIKTIHVHHTYMQVEFDLQIGTL